MMFDDDSDFSLATLQARQKKLTENDVIRVSDHIWEVAMYRQTIKTPEGFSNILICSDGDSLTELFF